jgi:hypothetical protein
MKILILFVALVAIYGCKVHTPEASRSIDPTEKTYVITAHEVVDAGLSSQEDDYTVGYGLDVLRVRYSSSQTSSAKPGDFPGTGLHEHRSGHDPDLSQVPQVGTPIRRCKVSADVTPDGDPIIDRQPTSDPCMIQFGDTLQYEPSPNAGNFTYVSFDVLSEQAK